MAKVGINGFGRIGKMLLRAAAYKKCLVEVVAINDRFDPKTMAYVLKYDTLHGKFTGDICYDDKHLIVNGKKIMVFNEPDVKKIPWDRAKVQYLAECTGMHTTLALAKPLLRAGVKKVIISAPSKDAPIFVVGVNTEKYCPQTDHIVSNASCTTNCLAPLVKVIHNSYEIVEGLMTTVHAVTSSQRVLDGFLAKDIRGGRTAFLNIIPSSTGAATAVAKVIPELKGKLTGIAFRVPVGDVSVVDLTCRLKNPAKFDEIKCTIREAAQRSMYGIIAYTEESIVSSDLIGSSYSTVFDAQASMALNDCFVKLVAWYDNEFGFANRMVDLIDIMFKFDCEAERCKMCK